MQPSDLLMDVLRLARQEGALEGERLFAFAAALAERAGLVVGERLSRAEARVDELEREVAWRRESATGLQQEIEWRRPSMAALQQEIEWRRASMAALEQEIVSLRQQGAALESQLASRAAEMDRLRRAEEAASLAHDRLLAHHRDVLARTVAELGAVAAVPLYRWPRARRRLEELAASLRREAE